MRLFQSGLLRLCAVPLAFAAGCTKTTTEESKTENASVKTEATEIVIGEVSSLRGSESTFGTSTHEGIEIAISEINATGGIHGKKIRLATSDDQSRADEAALGARQLITKENVVAIIGEVASSRSLAMAPIAQENGVPMISPSSTNPAVTKHGDYIFRVCFIDPFQGSVLAYFAANDLKVKNVAILRDVKSDYSVGLSDFFKEGMVKYGGSIVIDQSYSAGDVDFKAQLTAIKATNPQAIFVPGYYTEVGLIARQARELGINVPLLGGDGWDSEKLYEIGGDAVNNSFFSNHYSTDNTDPRVVEFISKYKTQYEGKVPDGLAALGYDAAKILFEAMKKTPTGTEKDKIRDALKEIKDFPGVTGMITFNQDRDAVKSAVVLKVDQGKFAYLKTIEPGMLSL